MEFHDYGNYAFIKTKREILMVTLDVTNKRAFSTVSAVPLGNPE